LGGLDKEVIRKQDYNHIYRAKQRQESKHKDKSQNGSCPCVCAAFPTFVRCSLNGKRTFLFSADSQYNIGEGRRRRYEIHKAAEKAHRSGRF